MAAQWMLSKSDRNPQHNILEIFFFSPLDNPITLCYDYMRRR